ncbi:MAG: LysM peptidoglycan-binding domain-containing protein [Humibacillus sp.]|nr:LysM peptidoglycan-binding domain-containing protein [Humibacillus sp.]MDN5778366.1 LysM peptidoglycan-binding domain-containing protein [Humibacillus sp.]
MPLAADIATLAPPPHALIAPLAAVSTSWKQIVVRPGDTLWDLSIRYHTTSSALAAKNRLHGGGHLLVVGQKLLVPGTTPSKAHSKAPSKPPKPSKSGSTASGTSGAASSSGSARSHVVVAGETMSGIAQRYGVSLTKLLAANRLPNAGMIFVGQRVTVPGTTSASPARAKPSKPSSKPSPQAAAVAHSKALLAGRSTPSRTTTAAMIRATALRNGVDPRLALAIGWQESSWNQRSVSYTNAVGVLQIMPISGTWASQLAGRKLDLYDAQDNITAGVLILRSLQRSADSREQAIAAYYQGLSSVRSRGLYSDTKAYVTSILKIYARM